MYRDLHNYMQILSIRAYMCLISKFKKFIFLLLQFVVRNINVSKSVEM